MRWLKFLLASMVLFQACSEKKLFVQTKNTGVEFTNKLTESDDFNILDYLYFYNGGGVAIGDINGDQLPDIYLSGNQVGNKLFLNKGNLEFQDITKQAGVEGGSDWNTGSVMADVNGDGLLDIYVCAVVGLRGLNGHNELFINNGDLTFTERSKEFGLDFDTYSSSAGFFDYDLDGDLDMYLLNHAIHTQESFGHANLREKRSYESGDRLLRNDNGKFTDVSEQAGIYGGVNGYGLGLAIGDFNKDGYPDIYIGNDFHEDDYYYLNQGDGTFKESLKSYFSFSSRFSMGNDVADINHDGILDILSLDMLPQDEQVLKSSEGDDNLNVQKMKAEQFGYHYQFTRNMLQIGTESGKYSETALLSGIAATDWSWSGLFADYNQDGEQDLFIANGIPRRPNDLDYIRYVSSDQIRSKMETTKLVDQKALEMMPEGAVRNYLYIGDSNLSFKDVSNRIPSTPTFSTAIAMGDLDNDGDLDLVINNVNGPSSIYENTTNTQANFLKVRLDLDGKNTFGLGTKAYLYSKGKLQYKELYSSRGFQASSEPIFHFGLAEVENVDSIRFVFPNNTSRCLTNVDVNQGLKITKDGAVSFTPSSQRSGQLFERVANGLGIDFIHRENTYNDFDRQKLIPFQASDRGPATAIGDLNGDGRDDIFFGSSKYSQAKIYIQGDSGFYLQTYPVLRSDSIREEVAAVIVDVDGDSMNDLIVGSGGAEFYGKMNPLLDVVFVQKEDGSLTQELLNETFQNAAVLINEDFDGDGDQDLFVGNHMTTGDYGNSPISYLYTNTNGVFSIEKSWKLGMITDAIGTDVDKDGDQDIVCVGEWMSPTALMNDDKDWSQVILTESTGLWQSIDVYDIDRDGDNDYLLGNWGLNSKYVANAEFPLRMYYGDFDENGSSETVLASAKSGSYYTLESLNGLISQLVYLRKNFTDYKTFAGKTVEEVFGEDLEKTDLFEVSELRSGYLKNDEGNLTFHPFEMGMQTAPILDFVVFDFDFDGDLEVLAGGNYFGVKPYHGRFGGFQGAMLDGERIVYGNSLGLDFLNKSIRNLKVFQVSDKKYLMVTVNNDSSQVYKF